MKKLHKQLEEHSDSEKAKLLQRFFKTGKGEYGEGDIFLGIVVPNQRKIAKEAAERLSMENLQELLNSKVHEKRLIALLILIEKYKKAEEKEFIFNFYLSNTKNINNWDLVDLSAPNILGDYLLEKGREDREILQKLAKSEHLWEKRISIISTFAFIRNQEFDDALRISELLLNDKHDLIHKAVGWMLREIGKRDLEIEENFLRKNSRYKEMPRTMLRYAIEKFPEKKRKMYLRGKIN